MSIPSPRIVLPRETAHITESNFLLNRPQPPNPGISADVHSTYVPSQSSDSFAIRAHRTSAILSSALLACSLIACSSGSGTPVAPVTTPVTPPAATPDFSSTIVIGDSLSSGFQNGSLLDTQQPNGWASLFAKQAGVNLVLPLMAPPGVPAVTELVSIGPPPVTTTASGTSTGRDDSSVQPTDLAVPGHHLHDLINAAPTALPTTKEDIITNLILGLPTGNTNTQLQEAIALKPTTLFVWIGSNDALVADDSGMPSSMTSIASFTADFTQLMTTLHSQSSARLIVANLPDVTAIPLLTTADMIIAEAAAQTGQPAAQLSTELGIASGDYVNATGLGEVKQAVADIQAGHTVTPLDDAGFLSATEVQQVQALENQYNQVIAQQVAAVGGTLIDLHAFFQKLSAGVTINGYNATTAYLGGLFSIDGTHPTNTGYALVANQVIDSLNTSLHTTIPDVDVTAIAAADPLFGPGIKPNATAMHISAEAAARAGLILHRRPLR